VRHRRRRLVGAGAEEEELGLHPGVHREAHRGRARDLALENPARVARERRAVGQVDVADEPRDARLGVPPREDLEGREVGREEHVRFLDAHETLDRRAVEHDVAGERLLELRRRDLDVLVDAEDVGELQAHRADVQLLGVRENVLRRRVADVGDE
jgi:hypothetical protein